MKKTNNEKKNKKDIYIIIACLFCLIVILLLIAFNKKEDVPKDTHKDTSQEVEKEETSNNKFPDYEINDNNFRKDTNNELRVLFDQEEINQNDIVKLSNSMVKGYLYLLESKQTGTVYMRGLSAKELGIITSEFLYTTQNKICTDMSFLEELISLLFDEVEADLETDEDHFNEYSNSYCLDRETNNYKYHLSYNNYSYTKDYVTISYKKVLDNKSNGLLKVYFKFKDNRYYLEKIDL